MSNRGWGQSLAWIGTMAAGTWLSVRLARWMTDVMGVRLARRPEPVREAVQEALTEHHGEDSPIVHAFEEALEGEEAEAAGVA